MTNFNENPDRILFFHVCTDGENNGIVHMTDDDYLAAIRISAICAQRYGVVIVCFVHMSTHSHFVIWCSTAEQAEAFANAFKRDYSQYVASKHKIVALYKSINANPKRITDSRYLKACISYVLMNPVAAKIVVRPEDYKWSSFNAYFNDSPVEGYAVADLQARQVRKLLHTHDNLSKSRLLLSKSGIVVIRSFVDYKFVERLFMGKTEFYRSLALTDYSAEESKYVPHVLRFSDSELYAELKALSSAMFNVDTPLLTKQQKIKLLPIIYKRTKVTYRRLARVLRLPSKEVASILGIITEGDTRNMPKVNSCNGNLP